jgi:hypothetical protein
LDRRLGGPQSRSGRGDEEKNSQLLPGLKPRTIHPVVQRYTAELTRLLMKIKWNERKTGSKEGKEIKTQKRRREMKSKSWVVQR